MARCNDRDMIVRRLLIITCQTVGSNPSKMDNLSASGASTVGLSGTNSPH